MISSWSEASTRPPAAYSGLEQRSQVLLLLAASLSDVPRPQPPVTSRRRRRGRLGELELGQGLAARRDVARQLGQLRDGRRAGGRRARRDEAGRGELELLERGDVVVHARDEALAPVRDVLAVAALI